MYNNSDNDDLGSGVGSSGGFSKRWSRRCRELLVDALSSEEWNYVFGLFLADGYSYITRPRKACGSRYSVVFDFQGDEGELADRLITLLRKAGLSPWKNSCRGRRKDMIEVETSSKLFLGFLPDKKALSNHAVARRAFFERNRLYDVRFGVPFLAGLIDGDGSCWVSVKDDCCFGSVSTGWEFAQSRYMFLVEYVRKFVGSLAWAGVARGSVRKGFGGDVVRMRFRESGVRALVGSGIACYSWKVARWLREVALARSERAKYYTVGRAASVLGVSKHIVRRWLESGVMTWMRRRVKGRGRRQAALSYYHVPIAEVEKLRKKPDVKLSLARKKVEVEAMEVEFGQRTG